MECHCQQISCAAQFEQWLNLAVASGEILGILVGIVFLTKGLIDRKYKIALCGAALMLLAYQLPYIVNYCFFDPPRHDCGPYT